MEQNDNPREQSVQKFVVKHFGTYRHFAVYEMKPDVTEELVCICVYKKGAVEVSRRLNELTSLLAALSPSK